MDYKVGYRRPPKQGQFAKGKSGNPKGRPKGSANFLTLLELELTQHIAVTENGKRKSITRLQAMVKRIVAGALQGDQKALLTLVEIMRRTGVLNPQKAETALPEDYQAALDEYMKRRPNASR